MFRKLTKATLSAMGIVAASVGLLAASAGAAPLTPGAPSAGPVTISPATGNSNTEITVLPPSPSFCPGDTATGGYNWQTFLTSTGIDVATLAYNGDGPIKPATAPSTAIVYPLLTFAGQSFISNQNTAVGTGLIFGFQTVGLNAFSPGDLPAGTYNIGYACSKNGLTEKYWSSTITLTTNPSGGPAQVSYTTATNPPDVPEAPLAVLLPLSALVLLGGAGLVVRRRRMAAF